MTSTIRLACLALSAIAGGITPTALAQATYPSKPIRIIAPVQPGGGVDLVARTIGERIGKALGQPVVIENQSGGGGIVGSQATARAAPDGYTLMVGYVGTHGTNPAVRKVPYDAVKDFTAIAMVGGTPNILVVHPSLPANDLKSLIAYAKQNSAKMNYASGGIGTLNHLAMEQFRADAGFEAVVAHYRGIGPAIVDVLSGQAMMMMPGLAAALPHIRSGKMRPIAITGLKRHPLVPEVPTFEESGFKGYDGVQWYGIVGPAKLPAEITKRLNAEVNKALATSALQERLSAEALEPMPMTPEQFGRFIQADIARWSKLARERRISLDD